MAAVAVVAFLPLLRRGRKEKRRKTEKEKEKKNRKGKRKEKHEEEKQEEEEETLLFTALGRRGGRGGPDGIWKSTNIHINAHGARGQASRQASARTVKKSIPRLHTSTSTSTSTLHPHLSTSPRCVACIPPHPPTSPPHHVPTTYPPTHTAAQFRAGGVSSRAASRSSISRVTKAWMGWGWDGGRPRGVWGYFAGYCGCRENRAMQGRRGDGACVCGGRTARARGVGVGLGVGVGGSGRGAEGKGREGKKGRGERT
ncbi:hypothetical protein BZA05DRAFT_41910 [Tricharina praecox]|uniref:uncharacterized protein n=1 Tax=Tricharina praecox TaxID=43433 RepID=UPI00221EE076|nr:uncharacterized protein BZA05DRAFT_41910 [Tricharina praecox]KAI5852331.1 hypothetical protein BZA05DRAFT_41910 [Tricharina praecox]